MIYLVIETDFSDDGKVSSIKAFERECAALDYLYDKQDEGDVNYGYELRPLSVVKS